jgi:uncharacterized protein YndB with AHSA1/START domain
MGSRPARPWIKGVQGGAVADNCRVIRTSPRRVFAVLADGWSYASWVVGAAHIRDVDEGWPAVGTRVHHQVGPWPLQIKDQTTVRAMEPDRLIELDAHAWPLGAATVRLELEPVGSDGTRVVMSETLSSGAGRLIPGQVERLFLTPRNAEALRRLDDLAVHRP